MYAVVKTGGKQHKVAVGEVLSVEKIDAAPGTSVTLPVLFVNDDTTVLTGAEAAAVTVTAEVLGQGKADKVLVFKLRKRKGSKTMRGHRQQLTLLKVTDISVGGKKAAKKSEAAEAVVVEAKVEKAAAPKKAAPKKAAAPKKPAARAAAPKPAAKPAAEKKPTAAKPAAEKKPAAAKKPVAKKADAAAKPAAAKKPAAKKTTKPAE